MARIELRHCTIRIKDGFSGTGAVDDTSIADGNTSIEIDTLAGLPNGRTTIPIGARFEITGVDETYTVTAQNANEKQQIVIDATGGDWDATFNGQTASNLAFDITAAALKTALEGLSNIAADDLVVTEPVDGTYVIEFRGGFLGTNVAQITTSAADLTGGAGTATVTTLRPGGTTWELTFTPALAAADLPANDDVITFLPIQIEIKIGEGNLTYTENKEWEYLTDRGLLDTVREGNEVPMDISLEFIYEFVRTGTGEQITPVDALKGIGGASDWTSASDDLCEPYCVDIEVEHTPPCGTAQTEITLFPEFRHDTLNPDLGAATIACEGRCKATEPTITRV